MQSEREHAERLRTFLAVSGQRACNDEREQVERLRAFLDAANEVLPINHSQPEAIPPLTVEALRELVHSVSPVRTSANACCLVRPTSRRKGYTHGS